MAKQIRVSFRTTQEFKERVQSAAKKVGLEETVIEAEAIKAVVAHIEQHGAITIPVRLEEPDTKFSSSVSVRPEISKSNHVSGLNEPEGEYRSKKRKAR
jgi:hypothetical protein